MADLLANRIGRGDHQVSGRDQHCRDGLGSEVNNHISKTVGSCRQQVASGSNWCNSGTLAVEGSGNGVSGVMVIMRLEAKFTWCEHVAGETLGNIE